MLVLIFLNSKWSDSYRSAGLLTVVLHFHGGDAKAQEPSGLRPSFSCVLSIIAKRWH
jgi:hypothetical protein